MNQPVLPAFGKQCLYDALSVGEALLAGCRGIFLGTFDLVRGSRQAVARPSSRRGRLSATLVLGRVAD
jgi:hypothetical protein